MLKESRLLDEEMDTELQRILIHDFRIEIHGSYSGSKWIFLEWVKGKLTELQEMGITVGSCKVTSEIVLSVFEPESVNILDPEDLKFLLNSLKDRKT